MECSSLHGVHRLIDVGGGDRVDNSDVSFQGLPEAEVENHVWLEFLASIVDCVPLVLIKGAALFAGECDELRLYEIVSSESVGSTAGGVVEVKWLPTRAVGSSGGLQSVACATRNRVSSSLSRNSAESG